VVTANATLLREKRSMVDRKDCSPRTKLSICHHRVHRSLLADCSQSRKAAVDPKRRMCRGKFVVTFCRGLASGVDAAPLIPPVQRFFEREGRGTNTPEQ